MASAWTLVLLLIAIIIAVIWHSALRAREQANFVAIETCKRLNVQFLDGTVAFSAIRPVRDQEGNFDWRRNYVFDYTEDGMTRRQGFVVLLGNAVEAVGLAPEARSVQ